MASGSITSWQIDGGKMEINKHFIFLGLNITADSDCSPKIKTLAPWKKSYDQPRQQRYQSHSYGFSSRHVWISELDHKEAWALKNWCFQTVVLEKTWESLGHQDQTSQSYRKSTLNIQWKDWFWSWNSNTFALMRRADSLEKTLMLGKTEARKRREQQRMRWLVAQ